MFGYMATSLLVRQHKKRWGMIVLLKVANPFAVYLQKQVTALR